MRRLAHIDSLTEAEWHETRRNGLGGSDIATIFSLNHFKAPLYLFLEKRGEIEPADLSSNESIYWGNQLEDVVRKEFAKRTGYKVQRNNFVLAHDEYDYLRANLDGEIITDEGRGVLEIKTTSEYMRDEWSGDHVPIAYMLQVQYYLAITNYSFAFLACLIGGNKYRHWRIERDDILIERILNKAHEFWARVQNNDRPAADGSKSSAEALSILHPVEHEQEETIVLDHDQEAAQLLTRHGELEKLISELEEEQKAIVNTLKGKIGDYTKAHCFDYVVSWKAPKQSYSIAAKDLQQVAPDIYEQIKKPKARTRTFKVKMTKK